MAENQSIAPPKSTAANACPACGYCAHCGRGGHYNFFPTINPYPYGNGWTVNFPVAGCAPPPQWTWCVATTGQLTTKP